MNEKETASRLAFLMGTVLLENGAEISRVQETIERVLTTYGVEEKGVYVISNALFVNAEENNNKNETLIKYVKSATIHLGRIAAVNQLSREIAEGKYTASEALQIAKKIKYIPMSAKTLQVIACAVGSAGFAYIFGGSVVDALVAFVCGFVLQLFLNFFESKSDSKIFSNMLASAIVGITALFFTKLGIGDNLEMIISGSIIRLVPGVALTTGIRDFFNSDYLSGTIRIIDAVLVGGSIAIGVGVVFKIATLLCLI